MLAKVYRLLRTFISCNRILNLLFGEISHRLTRNHISVKYRGKIFRVGGELVDKRNNNFVFDFTPIGQAIKKAREARGMTREQLSGIIGYAPRHIQAIENEGQYPSIELFIQLITMFDVSVDEYIFPGACEGFSVNRISCDMISYQTAQITAVPAVWQLLSIYSIPNGMSRAGRVFCPFLTVFRA